MYKIQIKAKQAIWKYLKLNLYNNRLNEATAQPIVNDFFKVKRFQATFSKIHFRFYAHCKKYFNLKAVNLLCIGMCKIIE